MRLHATCKMTVTASADCPVVAMLRPRSGEAQWMVSERYELHPWVPTTEYVDNYGNLCQRLKIPQGEMRIEVDMIMEAEAEIAVAPGAGPCRWKTCPSTRCSTCCKAATAHPTRWVSVRNRLPET